MKIEKKIVGYAVKQPTTEEKSERPQLRREGGGGDEPGSRAAGRDVYEAGGGWVISA